MPQKLRSRRPFVVAAILILGLALCRHASLRGKHWEWGRYGMPRTLLSADGQRFKNGDPADVLSRALAKSPWEEEAHLGMLAALVALACLHRRQLITLNKNRAECEEWKRRLAEARMELGRLRLARNAGTDSDSQFPF